MVGGKMVGGKSFLWQSNFLVDFALASWFAV